MQQETRVIRPIGRRRFLAEAAAGKSLWPGLLQPELATRRGWGAIGAMKDNAGTDIKCHAGKLLASFGQGQLIFPHGGTVDREGNLWMTDAGSAPGKGHQAIKFSPEGKILMTLGQAGVSGSGPGLFDQPTDVVVAPNGTPAAMIAKAISGSTVKFENVEQPM